MEEQATTARPIPVASSDDSGWEDVGTVAMGIAVLTFLIRYVWLTIRRFEKVKKP